MKPEAGNLRRREFDAISLAVFVACTSLVLVVAAGLVYMTFPDPLPEPCDELQRRAERAPPEESVDLFNKYVQRCTWGVYP